MMVGGEVVDLLNIQAGVDKLQESLVAHGKLLHFIYFIYSLQMVLIVLMVGVLFIGGWVIYTGRKSSLLDVLKNAVFIGSVIWAWPIMVIPVVFIWCGLYFCSSKTTVPESGPPKKKQKSQASRNDSKTGNGENRDPNADKTEASEVKLPEDDDDIAELEDDDDDVEAGRQKKKGADGGVASGFLGDSLSIVNNL